MKRVLLVLIVLSVVAGFWKRDALMERVMQRQIDHALARAQDGLLTDGGLHVFLCGTAAALPDPRRAGPCTAIVAGGEFIVVDAGEGSWRQVDGLNLPIAHLSALLITHLHSDHITDLGEAATQSWIAGRARPLDIYGPPGIDDAVHGFHMAYAKDDQFRIAHHLPEYMPPSGAEWLAHTLQPQGVDPMPVFERNGVKVTAFLVQHAPVDYALGYRVDFAGRSVVLSGDTIKTESVIKNAQGADLLLHEALAKDLVERAAARAAALGYTRIAKMARDTRGYHTTPVEAAEVAQAAGVKKLVYTHVFPPLPNRVAEWLFLRGTSKAFGGDIVLGQDGMRFDLPAHQ